MVFRTAFASIVALGLLGVGTAHAQSCASGLSSRMQQMADRAVQCGESADLMSSLQSGGSGRANLDELAASCRSKRSVSSQLSAFNECSRVYVCATMAYAYAIEHLSEVGGDCTAAAQEGLAHFPVN